MVLEGIEIEKIEGVGPVTKNKLLEAGINNMMDVIVRGPHGMVDVTGLDLERCTNICNKSRIKLTELGALQKDFVSATDVYEERKKIERISTGISSLDDLLDGGIETKAITEIYGEYGTGKTQICNTLCAMVQLPKEKGGLGAGAIYMDTEGTFRAERIRAIAEIKGLDPDGALAKIVVAKAYGSAHQELLLEDIGNIIKKTGTKLLIVDSAIAHYRAEFLGRGTLAGRQQRLNKFFHTLLRIAETYNVAVVVTNQIMASPDTFFGDPLKPTGGNVVAHTSTYRIYLKRSGKKRIARMVDSPSHEEKEIIFRLTNKGIEDIEETKPKKDEVDE